MHIKNEEYLALAKDLFASFDRDFDDFTTEDHNYTPEYKDEFKGKIVEVKEKEESNAVLVQQKQVTQALYLIGEKVIKLLKSLSIKIKRAEVPTKLDVEIRKDIKSRNFEGATDKLGKLNAVINNNATELEAKGMKSSVPNELKGLYEKMADVADKQTQLMKQVSSTSNENKKLYEELYRFITHICEDGKVIYEGQQKAEEYTISKMLKKLHRSPSGDDKPDTN